MSLKQLRPDGPIFMLRAEKVHTTNKDATVIPSEKITDKHQIYPSKWQRCRIISLRQSEICKFYQWLIELQNCSRSC